MAQFGFRKKGSFMAARTFTSLAFLTVVGLLLTACAKPYTTHEAHLIVFKTPSMAYADAGFVHKNEDAVRVELMQAGHPVMVLELNRKICLNGSCFKKERFIQTKLSPHYPSSLLHDIFLGRPLFNRSGLIEEATGFTQKLSVPQAYDINYKVTQGTIRFQDRVANILIKIQKL